ncbi:MAG: DMT family transporter [Gemmataceae bacterium]|nr:DMT family transporter [Gemmataceae bacterium]
MSPTSLRPYLWMLLGSFSFAWMGVLAHRVGADETHPLPWQIVAMFRSLIPLVVVGAWAVAAGVRLVFWRPRVLWVRSLAGSLSLIGTFFALTRLPISDVFTITNMFPVWVALLAWPMLGEFPSAKVWLSVACGAAGVVLIQRPHFARGELAALVAVAVSLFTALAMIGLHRLQALDTRAVVVHFSATAFVFAAAAYFLFERQRTDLALSGPQWAMLIGMGLCATLGQICLTKAYTTGDPAKISVVGLTQIVFALALDVIVLGHSLDPAKLLGVPLVIGPTAWLLLRRQVPKPQTYSDEPLETTPNINE